MSNVSWGACDAEIRKWDEGLFHSKWVKVNEQWVADHICPIFGIYVQFLGGYLFFPENVLIREFRKFHSKPVNPEEAM